MELRFFRGIPAAAVFRMEYLLPPFAHQVISLPTVDRDGECVTCFFLDKGEGISRDIQRPDILYIVLSGNAVIAADRTPHRLAAGDAMLAPSGLPHSIDAVTALHLVQISIEAPNNKGENRMNGTNYIKNIEKATALRLKELVAYQPDRVASLTLVQRDCFTTTLMAMAQGTGVGPHVCEGDAMVVALDGVGDVTIGEEHHTVHEGECIVMPADISHAVRGTESDFKMMLIVSKPRE